MNTIEQLGATLRGDDEEMKREAARLLGSLTSERKKKTSAENGRNLTQHTEETKARLREAQKARREREKVERASLGLTSPVEKKPVGRPRKQTTTEATESPKRGRGRPKKGQTGETLPLGIDGAENATGRL